MKTCAQTSHIPLCGRDVVSLRRLVIRCHVGSPSAHTSAIPRPSCPRRTRAFGAACAQTGSADGAVRCDPVRWWAITACCSAPTGPSGFTCTVASLSFGTSCNNRWCGCASVEMAWRRLPRPPPGARARECGVAHPWPAHDPARGPSAANETGRALHLSNRSASRWVQSALTSARPRGRRQVGRSTGHVSLRGPRLKSREQGGDQSEGGAKTEGAERAPAAPEHQC